MPSPISPRCLCVLLLLGIFGGLGGAHAAAALSPGLSPGAASGAPDTPALHSLVSATLGRGAAEFALSHEAGAYTATLRGGAAARMDERGFVVSRGGRSWGLSLVAIGRSAATEGGAGGGAAAAVRPAGKALATAAANRVTFSLPGVASWFVNGPAGLEQGWTIAASPAGAPGDVFLTFAQTGELRAASVSKDLTGLAIAPAGGGGRELLRYSGLAAYDARGSRLAAAFELLPGGGVAIHLRDRGAVYPVKVDPFVQVATLTTPTEGIYPQAISVSGDGSTVVASTVDLTVGGNEGQGAVWVFARPALGWANATQAAELTASDGAANDSLGVSVAVSADGSTVVAGAFDAAIGGNSDQGAVYIFTRPAGGWVDATQAAKLAASDGAAGDLLGYSVAVSDDGSNVAAGAYAATVGENEEQGAAYVFVRPGGGWKNGLEAAKLTASNGGLADLFGRSIAIGGGGVTVLVGAVLSQDHGEVYEYTRATSGWSSGTETARFTGSDTATGDQFGWSVAVSNQGTAVVGALTNTVNGHAAQGAAYVFTKPGSSWVQDAKLISSDGVAGSRFGITVAVDATGSIIAVGAVYQTVGSNQYQGEAYLYAKPALGWENANESMKLIASDGAANDNFGNAVALSSDRATLAVAADGNAEEAYIYELPTAACAPGATTLCLDDQPGDQRWQVSASYKTAEGGGLSGEGESIPLAGLGIDHGGLFWYFGATNPEVLIKVLNACGVDQQFWVFYSATTNVGFAIEVRDTKTGRTKYYSNTDGTAAPPVLDTAAFACIGGDAGSGSAFANPVYEGAPAPPGAPAAAVAAALPIAAATTAAEVAAPDAPEATPKAGCTGNATTICIDSRFSIDVSYHTSQSGGLSGSGQAISLASVGVAQGGIFWFFDATNPEMLVKVLDGCSVNDKFWVFYAAGTNVGFTVTVTDTQTGHVATYRNPDLTAAAPVQDTSALSCP